MTERYVIPYDRDFGQFSFREFNYAIHERTFRLAGDNATIGFNPYVSFPCTIPDHIESLRDAPTLMPTPTSRVGFPRGA